MTGRRFRPLGVGAARSATRGLLAGTRQASGKRPGDGEGACGGAAGGGAGGGGAPGWGALDGRAMPARGGGPPGGGGGRRAKGSKIRSRWSGGTPGPLSVTD